MKAGMANDDEFNVGDYVVINQGYMIGHTGRIHHIDYSAEEIYVDLDGHDHGVVVEFGEVTKAPEPLYVEIVVPGEHSGTRVVVLKGPHTAEAGNIIGDNTRLSEDTGEDIINVHLENGRLIPIARRNVVSSVYQGEALNA